MPGGDKAIRPEDGKQFSSTNQPANRGRKPRIFSQLAKEWKDRGIERATPEAVKEVYEYLLALTLADVIDIAGNGKDDKNDYPAIMRVAAAELIGKRKREILNDMLDRAHGKAKQATEITGKDGGPLETSIAPLGADQIAAIQAMLNAGNGKTDVANTANSGKRSK